MKIEHIAIFTKDLERSRRFYEKFFYGLAGEKYSEKNGFESYFIKFRDGARLEIMTLPDLCDLTADNGKDFTGFVHLAFSVGSESEVDKLTARIIRDGYEMIKPPRRTGDGYYESCVKDPDGNRLEIRV